MSLFLRYLFIAILFAVALLLSYWRGRSAQREIDARRKQATRRIQAWDITRISGRN